MVILLRCSCSSRSLQMQPGPAESIPWRHTAFAYLRPPIKLWPTFWSGPSWPRWASGPRSALLFANYARPACARSCDGTAVGVSSRTLLTRLAALLTGSRLTFTGQCTWLAGPWVIAHISHVMPGSDSGVREINMGWSLSGRAVLCQDYLFDCDKAWAMNTILNGYGRLFCVNMVFSHTNGNRHRFRHSNGWLNKSMHHVFSSLGLIEF